MDDKAVKRFRDFLQSPWQGIRDAEEFGKNRRNLYAVAATFLLFLVGDGRIEHTSLLGGSVYFERPWPIATAAILLLLYSIWRFEVTMPGSMVELWCAELTGAWTLTSSLRRYALPILQTDTELDPRYRPAVRSVSPWRRSLIIHGWRKKDGNFEVGHNREGEIHVVHYYYTRACGAVAAAIHGRAFADYILPRCLYVLAALACLWRIAQWAWSLHAADDSAQLLSMAQL